MKRRHFFMATGVAAGALATLSVGWALLPPRQRLQTRRPLAAAGNPVALNGWLAVAADDSVVIAMPKAEMGQGVQTGLAMVLADELDADWTRVRLEAAPRDPIFNNLATVVDGLPFHPDDDGLLKQLAGWLTAKTMREIGIEVTGGSSSMKDLWLPMRQAGASARAMLLDAAAAHWQVATRELTVQSGVVRHAASQRAARFGELAAAASRLPLPEHPELKQPAQFRLIGQPLPRLEAAAKGTGTAVFGLDVVQPGMLYASVAMCPTLGGGLASRAAGDSGFDATAVLQRPGVKQVLAVPGFHGGTAGVAVVADTPWQAMQALAALPIRWDDSSPAAAFNSADALDQLSRSLDTETGFAYFQRGDVDAALKGAAKTISAEYRAPWLAHATLEPMNATVQVNEGRVTVWAPTQVPGLAQRAAALATGIAAERVDVHVTLLGGGFGRRLDVDFIGQAAFIAKAVGAQHGGVAVQTFWSREQDMRHDFYRPAAVSRFSAGFDAQGRLLGWRNTSAGQAVVPQVLQRLFGLPAALARGGPDKTTAEGAFDQPYEWPAARIAHHTVDLPVPVGFWRSVGHSHQAFFKESFVDEAAHAVGQDPLAFRAALLQQHPRHLAVLQRAAELAGWRTPPPPARDGATVARGLALHQSFGSIVAQVAEVSLAPDRTIRVHRVCCAIDCGTPVNPNLIRQQMESAIVFGLGAALQGRVDIVKGRVVPGNFHEQPLLRLDACPAIEVDIIASREHPEGVGEPGTPPVAPAVANALFALTGQRLRTLPLTLDAAGATAGKA